MFKGVSSVVGLLTLIITDGIGTTFRKEILLLNDSKTKGIEP